MRPRRLRMLNHLPPLDCRVLRLRDHTLTLSEMLTEHTPRVHSGGGPAAGAHPGALAPARRARLGRGREAADRGRRPGRAPGDRLLRPRRQLRLPGQPGRGERSLRRARPAAPAAGSRAGRGGPRQQIQLPHPECSGLGRPGWAGGGGSFGMVVVEATRRGKQLGEVHGFAAAAVEFVDGYSSWSSSLNRRKAPLPWITWPSLRRARSSVVASAKSAMSWYQTQDGSGSMTTRSNSSRSAGVCPSMPVSAVQNVISPVCDRSATGVRSHSGRPVRSRSPPDRDCSDQARGQDKSLPRPAPKDRIALSAAEARVVAAVVMNGYPEPRPATVGPRPGRTGDEERGRAGRRCQRCALLR